MAMLVLLSFDDDEHAKTLIEDGARLLTSGQENEVMAEVVAVYKRPTLFCSGNCPNSSKKQGWTKGRKYGWWICPACGKPSPLVWASIMERESSFGKNLLQILRQQIQTSQKSND